MMNNIYNDNDLTLILMRHGDYSDNPSNRGHLNQKGKTEVSLCANFIAGLELNIDAIWHSEKPRALETAEIVSNRLSNHPPLKPTQGLLPLDDIHHMVNLLHAATGTIMCVTHLPFVERLSGELVLNYPDQHIIQYKTATTLCLGRCDLNWHIEWFVSPDILR
jgi:phosphohistidine phosphatase SixA